MHADRDRICTMTSVTLQDFPSPRRAFAIAASLVALLVTAPVMGADAAGTVSERIAARQSPERIQVAGRLGSAVTGAAAASRLARERKSGEEKSPANADAPAPADADNAPSGPFKVIIPSQQADAPATTAPPVAPAAKSQKDGRPPVEKSQAAGSPPAQPAAKSDAAAATSAGQAAQLGKAAVQESPCIAGCYSPTAAFFGAAPVRQAGSAARAAGPAQAQPPTTNTIECVAGCGDAGGAPMPRAAAPSAPASGAQSAEPVSGRVTVLRGVSRTKTYGVAQ